MATYDDAAPNPGLVPYRIGQLESFRRDVENWRLQVDDDRNDLKYMRKEINDLARSVDGLRKTLLGFAITIAASCVIFALTVLSARGKV